jgi:hypothetical protein
LRPSTSFVASSAAWSVGVDVAGDADGAGQDDEVAAVVEVLPGHARQPGSGGDPQPDSQAGAGGCHRRDVLHVEVADGSAEQGREEPAAEVRIGLHRRRRPAADGPTQGGAVAQDEVLEVAVVEGHGHLPLGVTETGLREHPVAPALERHEPDREVLEAFARPRVQQREALPRLLEQGELVPHHLG